MIALVAFVAWLIILIYMYTNPDPVCINKLPEPFQTAAGKAGIGSGKGARV
jgi:hypothetical protein